MFNGIVGNVVRIAALMVALTASSGVEYARAVQVSSEMYRCRIYSCYLSGNMGVWLQILKEMDVQCKKVNDGRLQFELIRSYYGYIPFAISKSRNDEAGLMLDKASDLLENYLEKHPKDAEALAVKAAFYGYRMALSPIKASYLGIKSINAMNLAMKYGSSNGWVVLDKANSLLYTPKIFGGDPEKAISLYIAAIDSLVKQGVGECSWNLLNAYVNMAGAYVKLKQYDKAMQTYRKIVSIAPNFRWVRNELIPNLERKINAQ